MELSALSGKPQRQAGILQGQDTDVRSGRAAGVAGSPDGGGASFFSAFFAREEVFRWPAETVRQLLAVGGRAALIASALSSGAGFCAAVSGSVYLAMGAPFLTFSLLMIFRERYLEKLYCMDPSCWLLGQGYWGEDQRGNLSCTGVPKQKPGSKDLQPGGDSGSGFGNGDAEKYLFLFRDCGAPGDH